MLGSRHRVHPSFFIPFSKHLAIFIPMALPTYTMFYFYFDGFDVALLHLNRLSVNFFFI